MKQIFELHSGSSYQYFNEDGYHFVKKLNSYKGRIEVDVESIKEKQLSQEIEETFPDFVHSDCKYFILKDGMQRQIIAFNDPARLLIYHESINKYRILVEDGNEDWTTITINDVKKITDIHDVRKLIKQAQMEAINDED